MKNMESKTGLCVSCLVSLLCVLYFRSAYPWHACLCTHMHTCGSAMPPDSRGAQVLMFECWGGKCSHYEVLLAASPLQPEQHLAQVPPCPFAVGTGAQLHGPWRGRASVLLRGLCKVTHEAIWPTGCQTWLWPDWIKGCAFRGRFQTQVGRRSMPSDAGTQGHPDPAVPSPFHTASSGSLGCRAFGEHWLHGQGRGMWVAGRDRCEWWASYSVSCWDRLPSGSPGATPVPVALQASQLGSGVGRDQHVTCQPGGWPR